jgi:hypothetical protein
MATERKRVIKRRRQRKKRIGKLKKQFEQAKTKKEREHYLDLIQRRDPFFNGSEE